MSGGCPISTLLSPNTPGFFRRDPEEDKRIRTGQWKRNESPTEARKKILNLFINKSSKPLNCSKKYHFS